MGDSEPDPRFTLANERTFLAWIRTALALIGGGLAASQLLGGHSRAEELIVSLVPIALGGWLRLPGPPPAGRRPRSAAGSRRRPPRGGRATSAPCAPASRSRPTRRASCRGRSPRWPS